MQELTALKNPTILKKILESMNKSALIIFLQQRLGISDSALKDIPKNKLVDEVIASFDLSNPGCNSVKKYSLSSSDKYLLNEIVKTSDLQRKRDILNNIDSRVLYALSCHFNIPNAEKMSAQELRNVFIRLSSKNRTPQPQQPQPQPQQPQQQPQYNIDLMPTSPIVTTFLNAKTISERREILKALNKQQLFVLAKYFSLINYKNDTRENIVKKLLYNIPPPVITSMRPNAMLSAEQIISGFLNAQTIATRKEYLNTLDRRGLYILAEKQGVPNYKKKKREDLFKDLVNTKFSPRYIGYQSCNIPVNTNYLSEKESRLVKSFINATTNESKKKFLNSLSQEELIILAKNLKIYGVNSLSVAQLREQIFKVSFGGMSLLQRFELAQNEEQRKSILTLLDKRELFILAKNYNITNINKMPAEYIRQTLYKLPYLNYNPSYKNTSTSCQTSPNRSVVQSNTNIVPVCTATTCQTSPNRSVLSPARTEYQTSSDMDMATLARLPPPISPGNKIITPFKNRNVLQQGTNIVLTPAPNRQIISTSPIPIPPMVPSRKQISQKQYQIQRGKYNYIPKDSCVKDLIVEERQPSVKATIQNVPTSFTKSPLRVKTVDQQPLVSRPCSTNSIQSRPSSIDEVTRQNLFNCASDLYLNQQHQNTPSVEISNIPEFKQTDLKDLENVLDSLYYKVGHNRKGAIKNKDLIKNTLSDYLEKHALYTEDGQRITVNNYTFYSNGIVLLGDQKGINLEEIRSKLPDINWKTISGIIGVGLVWLYGYAFTASQINNFGYPINPTITNADLYNVNQNTKLTDLFYDVNQNTTLTDMF